MKKHRKKATPQENGWKYFSINLDLIEHKIVRKQMDLLSEYTGKTKKKLFKEMLDERINKEINGGFYEKVNPNRFNG
jgi:predicted DNA-binding protein|tara:strand:- start:401 stop:631 length:231 start_codon:yes stop_codon:yes gene_type:complete